MNSLSFTELPAGARHKRFLYESAPKCAACGGRVKMVGHKGLIRYGRCGGCNWTGKYFPLAREIVDAFGQCRFLPTES